MTFPHSSEYHGSTRRSHFTELSMITVVITGARKEEIAMPKQELVKMLNDALELEHAARIQYLAHTEQVDGLNAEPIIARLKEIAADELKHEEMFRTLIGDYLDGVPSMDMSERHPAGTVPEILRVNLNDEKHAVDVYTGILEKVREMRGELKYEYFQLEHSLRHIIADEQEHISELRLLLGGGDS